MLETFYQRWARRRAREARFTELERLWVYERNMARCWGSGWYLVRPARPLTSDQLASMQRFSHCRSSGSRNYYEQRAADRDGISMGLRWAKANGLHGGK
jgi:hypothetical protein